MQDVDRVNVSGAAGSVVDLDDGALLALARDGDQEAYAALFTRYSYAALRLARHLGQKEDSDDVVSESFAQVLDLVRRGKGPERAFRAYLFTTVRHEAARRAKARQRVTPTDDVKQIDQSVPFGNGRLDEFERSAIRAAYESLPQRWRTVLWHLDVEGRKPHELGPILDLTPNSVSALVYRARSGLREAYLQQHVNADDTTDNRTCGDVRSKLSAFVRRTASSREQERVHSHLESCTACMSIYLDLQEVNREVGAIVAPATLALSVSGVAVAAAGVTSGVAEAVTRLVLLGKGLFVALAPPAAAAALTTATIVGVTGSHLLEARQSPRAVQAAALPLTPPAPDGRTTTSPASGTVPTGRPTREVPAAEAARVVTATAAHVVESRRDVPAGAAQPSVPAARLGSTLTG